MQALEPYLGRGRLPVLERVPLAQHNKTKVDVVDKLAWSLGVDDAYGHDRFSMTAAVLKQFSCGQALATAAFRTRRCKRYAMRSPILSTMTKRET